MKTEPLIANKHITRSERKYWAIIPASGIGQRMGGALPKQYIELEGSAVIEHSIKRFLSLPNIEGIVVALNENDHYWKELSIAKHDNIYSVIGGKERMHSVYNALNFIAEQKATIEHPEQTFVLVHDAVRPCVRISDVQSLFEGLGDHDGAILASPLVDTLKRSDGDMTISTTLERDNCWKALTPQLFSLPILKKSIEALSTQGRVVSDDSAALEAFQYDVKIIEGHADNIKLTVPGDLALIKSILKQQKDEETQPTLDTSI